MKVAVAEKRTPDIRWGIYHQDREFARETGDPCLAVVTAPNKHEAEHKARHLGVYGPTGLWAHRLPAIQNLGK